MPGALFVVATPIGNLEDLTFRALRTLKEVDLIAAEDTRRTSKLLAHYDIRKPLVSVREHNEVREAAKIVARIAAGQSVAMVTDAGTPGIADPGSRLVAAVRGAGLKVVPIPGPSAVVAALSVSGIAADRFTFHGFPPRSGKSREDWLATLSAAPEAHVFFEAPHRISRTLADVRAKLVERQIIVHREISKINEISVILPNISPQTVPEIGEFVVVIGPAVNLEPREPDHKAIFALYSSLTGHAEPIGDDVAMDLLGKYFDVDSSVVRKSIKKSKISIKQQN